MANLTMEKQLEIYTHEGTLALPQRLRTSVERLSTILKSK